MLATAGVGLITGYPAEILSLSLMLVVARQYSSLYRMIRWLRTGAKEAAPREFGPWREITGAIQSLRSSSRKRKRKLSRMLKGFREAMSALPEGTIVLDEELKIQWWNPEAGHLFALEAPPSRNRPIAEIILDDGLADYLEQASFEHPIEVRSPVDPSIRLSIRIVPYGKGQNLLQAKDVTRLRELEQVRKDFVANASHELRNPLTVVLGYLETLRDSRDLAQDDWRRVFGQMYQQADRIKGIVNDMLMLSAVESETSPFVFQRFDVRPMLESLKEEADALSSGKMHKVQLSITGDTNLDGNPDETLSAFSNLISNAVRYTPEGGEIDLRWWVDDTGAHFAVADTGIGIDAAHIPRLTERFYRVDKARSRETGGTGLGLAIVKHALGRSGGRLTIESTPGAGSTFTCHFSHPSSASSATKANAE